MLSRCSAYRKIVMMGIVDVKLLLAVEARAKAKERASATGAAFPRSRKISSSARLPLLLPPTSNIQQHDHHNTVGTFDHDMTCIYDGWSWVLTAPS